MSLSRRDLFRLAAALPTMPLRQEKPEIRVSLDIQFKDIGLDSLVISSVSRQLRTFPDVVITDAAPRFFVRVVGFPLRRSNQKTGMVAYSMVITEKLTLIEAMRCSTPMGESKSDPDLRSFFRNLEMLKDNTITVDDENANEIADYIVARLNTEALEPFRKSITPPPGVKRIQ